MQVQEITLSVMQPTYYLKSRLHLIGVYINCKNQENKELALIHLSCIKILSLNCNSF